MDFDCYPERLVCFMSDKSVNLSASEGSYPLLIRFFANEAQNDLKKETRKGLL